MAKSEKPTDTAQTQRSQVPSKWNTTNLQSSNANFCNASSTREEVAFNFGVNKSWDRNANAKDGLEIDLNHRIVLSPFAAKRLSALLRQLKEYEIRYGFFMNRSFHQIARKIMKMFTAKPSLVDLMLATAFLFSASPMPTYASTPDSSSARSSAQSKENVDVKYDVTISICKFVAVAGDPELDTWNGVSGGGGAEYYYVKRGLEMPNGWKSRLVQGPAHGVLVTDPKFPKDFIYHPNEGFTGSDRVIFEVDVNGKHFKVTQNLMVEPGAPDTYDSDQDRKSCSERIIIKETRPDKSRAP